MPHKSITRLFTLLFATLLLIAPSGVRAQETEEPTQIPPAVSTPGTPPAPAATRGAPPITRPAERPIALSTITEDDLMLELLFDRVLQGGTAVMRLTGPDIAGADLSVFDRTTMFFPDDEDDWYAIFSAGMDVTANREYDFVVTVAQGDGTTDLTGQVRVVLGGFIRQDDLAVPPDRAYLVNPDIERTEFARMDGIFATVTEQQFWAEDGFAYPINAEITSPFGAFRVFNGTTEARHTGWDIRAAVGTPIEAMGSGQVAFAGPLDIRGNHVIIDHGYGIFSGYSHLSQVHVTRGQPVQIGQIIGMSGNTGRSSGPHLHWEVTVNGEWVDSVDFLNTWLP